VILPQENKKSGPAASHPGPPISVVLVTYNHEAYVAESVRSILAQTSREFELIVVDSGSTDKTPEILRSFKDERMSVLTIDNRGPSHAINAGIAMARGDYVALLSGDDVADPERLRKQWREAQERGVPVIASQVAFIGETGNEISPPRYLAYLKNCFGSENAPRAEVLLRLLEKGNFLNVTTLFVSRDALKSIYRDECVPFHPLLLQLQDFDLWIRLFSLYEFWVIPEPLMKYRVRSKGRNLSAPSETVVRRSRTEAFLLLSQFLQHLPASLSDDRGRLLAALLSSKETSHQLAAIQFLFLSAKPEREISELDFAKRIGDLRIFHTQPPSRQSDEESLPFLSWIKRTKYKFGRLIDEIRGNS